MAFKSTRIGDKIKSEILGWGGSKAKDELGDKILEAVENIEKESRI